MYTARRRFKPQTYWRSLRKTSGLGLDDMSLASPPWFNYWFSFTLSHTRISHEYSSLFIILMDSTFYVFALMLLTELVAFMRTEFLCFSVLRVTSGPREKLAGRKRALTAPIPPPPRPRPPEMTVLRRQSRCWSYSLLLCGLFYVEICFMYCLVLFSSCVSQSF